MMDWARAWRRAAFRWRKRCREAEREARKWRRYYGAIGVALGETGYFKVPDNAPLPPEYQRMLDNPVPDRPWVFCD